MEKKRNNNPCEGCVRRTNTSEDKVLCLFPKCVRDEYAKLWPRSRGKDDEKEGDR